MSRLVDLYTDDGRVVVGRSPNPYPVSVGVGFGIVGQVVTGFSPITTQVQTGWYNIRDPRQTRPNTPRFQHLGRHWAWKPTYTTVTTGYAPVYSPVFGAVYSPMTAMFGGIY